MMEGFLGRVRSAKTIRLRRRENKHVVDVQLSLTKPELKNLFQQIYGVRILKIHSHNLPPRKRKRYGKAGFQGQRKRVIFTLKKGLRLPLLTSVGKNV